MADIRYKIKGNNFSTQIENGKKYKSLISEVYENQKGEHKYPLNFIDEIAHTSKVVKHEGSYYLKDYSYKGTITKFEFLDDKNFLEALNLLDRPSIRKFADGGMTDKIEIELSDKHMDVKNFNGLLAGQMTILRDLQKNYIGIKGAEETKAHAKSELKKRINFTGNASDETKEKALDYLTLDVVSKALGNKGLYADGGDVDDNLLEFTIPNWALSSLVNGDDSGLEDEDIEKIDRFVNKTVAKYGNAFFMLPDESEMDLGFEPYNDIDNLGSDCSLLYLRPSKKYENGGMISKYQAIFYTEDGGEQIDSEYYSKRPSNNEIEKLAKKLKSKYIELYRDKHNDDSFDYLEDSFDMDNYANGGETHELADEYQDWLIDNNLPQMSADELLVEESVKKTDSQKKWLKDFIQRWDKAQDMYEDGGETDEDENEEDENQQRLEELADEYSIPTEVIEEYASNMGIEISEITDLPYNGRYNSEEDYAEQMVEEGVITDLSYYLEMTPTDMRILAQEEADNRIDNMDDDDILSEADMEDEANEYQETKDEIDVLEDEISDLKSEIDDLFEDEDEDTTEGELEEKEQKAKELRDELNDKENDLDNLQDKLASLDTYDEVVEKAREEQREIYYDDIYDALEKDAVGYFVDELGYNVEDLAKNNLFRVDYEKLARELGYDVTYIEHDGEVYVFSNYEKGGMTYAKGGGIPNNYRGKTTDDIWNMLSENQRLHFLFDHAEHLKVKTNQLPSISQKKWNELSGDVKEEFKLHTMMGQYADGGMMAKGGEYSYKIESADVMNSDKVFYGGNVFLNGEGIVFIPYNYDSKQDAENRAKKIIEELKQGTFKGYNILDNKYFMKYKLEDGGMMAKGGVTYGRFSGRMGRYAQAIASYIDRSPNGITYDEMARYLSKEFPSKTFTKQTIYSISRTLYKTKDYLIDDDKDWKKSVIKNKTKMSYGSGGVTFEDKVESISKALYKRKKVSPSVQKDYGKTYNKKEAIESAKRIAGAMRKKESMKKKS